MGTNGHEARKRCTGLGVENSLLPGKTQSHRTRQKRQDGTHSLWVAGSSPAAAVRWACRTNLAPGTSSAQATPLATSERAQTFEPDHVRVGASDGRSNRLRCSGASRTGGATQHRQFRTSGQPDACSTRIRAIIGRSRSRVETYRSPSSTSSPAIRPAGARVYCF